MNTPPDEHPRGPSSVVMQRVIAAIALGVAFLVLGSVFAPSDISATPGFKSPHDANDSQQQNAEDESDPSANPPIDAWGDVTLSSADPHLGLPLVGTLENDRYRTFVYSTDAGPRYTVYQSNATSPLAVLLDRPALARLIPDLPLPELAHGETVMLMLAEPDAAAPR